MALQVDQYLKRVVPSPKVPLSVTFIACTDSITLSWVPVNVPSPLSYSSGLKISKMISQSTTSCKRKHATLTIPKKLEIIGRLGSD
jgi:hypothetical protein